jgi:hypothetical protein
MALNERSLTIAPPEKSGENSREKRGCACSRLQREGHGEPVLRVEFRAHIEVEKIRASLDNRKAKSGMVPG